MSPFSSEKFKFKLVDAQGIISGVTIGMKFKALYFDLRLDIFPDGLTTICKIENMDDGRLFAFVDYFLDLGIKKRLNTPQKNLFGLPINVPVQFSCAVFEIKKINIDAYELLEGSLKGYFVVEKM